MNILVLSRKWSLYTVRRLRQEGARMGHRVEVVDPFRCILSLGGKEPCVRVGERRLSRPDVVLPRIGTWGAAYAISVVRHFDLMKVPVVNPPAAIELAKNKLGCLQRLAARGIPVPETLILRYPRRLDRLIRQIGGLPIVLKLLRGTQGMGVVLAESLRSAESMLETIWSLGEDILIQHFVSESGGRDIRALVIHGRVRAAMRRVGPEGEFRSNIHRGGVGEAVALDPEYGRTAVRAARAVGLNLAGVDMLESARGPQVIEVNASPGFEGLEEATGRNIARMFLEAAVRAAREARGKGTWDRGP